MAYSVGNVSSAMGTVVNTMFVASIAIPAVLIGILYWTISSADFQNSTVSTVVADDGTITTKRTIP